MAFTISQAYADWLKVHGYAQDETQKIIEAAAAKFPDLAGKAAELEAAIVAGYQAAGADPASALALARKAVAELTSGTAGVDPNAFGGGG